jgi:hypothetical protein
MVLGPVVLKRNGWRGGARGTVSRQRGGVGGLAGDNGPGAAAATV